MFKKTMLAVGMVILVALIVVRTFFIDFFTVPQNGMFPAIPQDTRVFVNLRAYDSVTDVKRGDIAIYNHQQDGLTYKYIWRVVGLPGDHVQTQDKSLTINGNTFPQLHKRDIEQLHIYEEQHPDGAYEICFDTIIEKLPPDVNVTLGPDEFFMMGDNRYSAADSRYSGPVKFSAFVGKKL